MQSIPRLHVKLQKLNFKSLRRSAASQEWFLTVAEDRPYDRATLSMLFILSYAWSLLRILLSLLMAVAA